MENTKQKILSAERRGLDSKQVLVECVINLENGENIEKVLALTANAGQTNLETFEKETKFSGEVFVNLFYLTSENKIDSISCTCSYQDTFKHDALKGEQKVKAEPRIVAVVPTSASEDTIKVLVTVEIDFILEGNALTEVYENNDSDFCVKAGEITLNVLAQDVSGEFPVAKVLDIKEKIKKVLLVDSGAIIKNTTTGNGFVAVQGEVYSYIVYAREDGSVTHAQISESFKEEFEADKATKESMVETNVYVSKKSTTLEIEEHEASTSLTLTTPLKVTLKVYNAESFSTVEDLYSLKNNLEVLSAQVSNTSLIAPKYFEGKIEGNLTLNDNNPRIDKVLAVSSPRHVVSNTYVSGGEVYVEGVVYSNLVYLNDETESINSVEIEVPFVTSEKLSVDANIVAVKTQIALSDCDVIAKRGREIYFDCKIKAYSNFWEEKSFSVISGAVKGKEFAARDSAIEIYFAKTGETFWDIAKELKVAESVVKGQNPSVVSPLECDEKIVVYYGLD